MRINQNNPNEAAEAKLEEAFIEFIRASLGESDSTPIVLDGYLFQLQATKFDPDDEDGRLPLVWGRKPNQSRVTTFGLVAVLERNIDLEIEMEESE